MTPAVPDQARARRGLAIYFAVLLPLSALFQALIFIDGRPIGDQPLYVLGLMWSPAIASIVARITLREGVRDVSFRIGGREGLRGLVIAWLAPVLVGGIAYGIAWATRLAPIREGATIGGFSLELAMALTFVTAISMLTAFGEELGWRGYMLTRFIDAGVPAPILMSGIVWGLWHVPLILSGQYAAGPSPLLSTAMFMIDVVAAGYLAAYLRLRSGSVWPAALFHAAWNAVIQGPFDQSTEGVNDWVGEGGVLVAIVHLVVVVAIVRGTTMAKRAPDDATPATLALFSSAA